VKFLQQKPLPDRDTITRASLTRGHPGPPLYLQRHDPLYPTFSTSVMTSKSAKAELAKRSARLPEILTAISDCRGVRRYLFGSP
jgi:hypothetical protein